MKIDTDVGRGLKSTIINTVYTNAVLVIRE
jgi:hypothetical protein